MPSSFTTTASSSTTTFSSSTSCAVPMSITNATKASYLSPQEEYLTDQHVVSDYPSSSAYSPVELAPLLNISDNRPPSPDSPKLKKFTLSTNHSYYHQQHCPPFLEPTPQLKIHETGFFPLDLFKVFKTKIPTLRRSSSIQSLPSSRYSTASPPVSCSIPTTDSAMSPIMAAASASAAAAANHRNPGSQVAKSLLESIGTSVDQHVLYPTEVKPSNKKQAAIAAAAAAAAAADASNVDQSMFLTKNAHIKRPRNAWIHFRCHYGQALKSQDPTLRAEEISKRASRRWGKLSEKEKRPWHGLAEQEKLAHREAFPEYRYCPRRANSSSCSSSSTTAPPSPPHHLANNRPRSASQVNTPLSMHDFNHSSSSSRAQKRMKRMK
ncbi:hypothetical protein MBANPS3_003537 [Mucor bainieri]